MESVQHREVTLVDLRAHPRLPITAAIFRDFSVEEIFQVEEVWRPVRQNIETGQRLWEHGHWDWQVKCHDIQTGSHRVIAVKALELVQGMLALRLQPRPSRIDTAVPLLYIDYLETAPWNLQPMASLPWLGAVGTVLVREAAWISVEAGFEGRIGLHSLPQAETFYRDFLGMFDWGSDPGYSQLHYFEYNTSVAKRFLEKSDRGS